MRSVVTGGGGFLGHKLVEKLVSKGHEVVSVSRKHYPSLTALGVEQVQGDIRDLKFLIRTFRGADQVFHTAAQVGIWGEWETFFSTNVKGTGNVLEACRMNRIPRLIFTSSPSVVFDGQDHKKKDETLPYATRWLSPYPRSKKMAEELVLAANEAGQLQTIALRPHLIWGKGDPHLIPRIVEQGRSGKLRRIGDGKNLVDVIHVENAAEAHLLAAVAMESSQRCGGKAYFLSQGEPVVLWKFIDDILKAYGVEKVRKSLSFECAYRLGSALEWGYKLARTTTEPRMTRFLALSLSKHHYYSIQHAREDFGYHPKKTVQEGLEELRET